MKKLAIISLMTVIGLSTTSCHSVHKLLHGKKHGERYFNKMDANNDGFITKKEYNQYTSDKFTKMDTDKNGKICMREFSEYKRNHHKRKK